MASVLAPTRGENTTFSQWDTNKGSQHVGIKPKSVPGTFSRQESTDKHEYPRRARRSQAAKVVPRPHSNTTVLQGWSENARSKVGKSRRAGVTFTLGDKREAAVCSSCTEVSQSPSNCRILLTPLPCQCPAVACIPTGALHSGDRVDECLGENSRSDETVQSSSPRVNTDTPPPTRYHAYFRDDTQEEPRLKAGKETNTASQETSSRTRQKFLSKLKKCLTVDPENNIKCMISLCDDACIPVFGQRSTLHRCAQDGLIHHPRKQKKCRSITHNTGQTSPQFRQSPQYDFGKQNKRAKAKGLTRVKRNPLAPHHSRSGILCSPDRKLETFHMDEASLEDFEKSDVHTDSSDIVEDSQNMEADLDFLQTPIMCPLNVSPRMHEKTPPTVSLDNYQLVYLYKLALKKVGVGFRLSPIDLRAAHLGDRFKSWGDQPHTSVGYSYPVDEAAEQSFGHQAFVSPCRTKCAGPHSKFHNLSVNAEQTQTAESILARPMPDAKQHEPCHKRGIEMCGFCSQNHKSPTNARDLGNFGNELIYVFSSPSPSSRAPCASPGHTNRCGLYACSTPPKCVFNKRNNSRQPHDKQIHKMVPKHTKLPKSAAANDMTANYHFVSCSPSKHLRLKEKNVKNVRIGHEDIEIKNTDRKISKTQKNLHLANEGKRLDENHTLDKSTLDRLECVVQKLTDALKQKQSAGKHDSRYTPKTHAKPSTRSSARTSPKSKHKFKLKRPDQNATPARMTQSARYKSGILKPQVPVWKKEARDSVRPSQIQLGRPSPVKRRAAPVARTPTTPLHGRGASPFPHNRRNTVALQMGDSFLSRGPGPPLLRTAARVAAKSMVFMEPETVKPGKKRLARNSREKNSKKIGHDVDNNSFRQQFCMVRATSSPRAKRDCSIGAEPPNWRQAEFPLKKHHRLSVTSRRSPKNYNANLNDDAQLRQVQKGKSCPAHNSRQIKLTSPRHYSTPKKESSAKDDYQGHSRESRLTGSLSFDTSWDVSARQIFD